MDCESIDIDIDSGAEAVDTADVEEVSVDGADDSSSAYSSCGDDSGEDTTWVSDADSVDSTDGSGCGEAGETTVRVAEDTSDASGDHCAPADSPSLSDPSVDEVATVEAATPASQPVSPAAASPLVALPDHVGVPGENLGSSPDSGRIVTPGVFTPTSFDANGNATHVSYSGVIEPARTTEVFGGNQTSPIDAGITDPNYWRMREMANQANADMATSWLTGVTVDRSGSSPTYYGAGKPFDDFGEALGNERDPRP